MDDTNRTTLRLAKVERLQIQNKEWLLFDNINSNGQSHFYFGGQIHWDSGTDFYNFDIWKLYLVSQFLFRQPGCQYFKVIKDWILTQVQCQNQATIACRPLLTVGYCGYEIVSNDDYSPYTYHLAEIIGVT